MESWSEKENLTEPSEMPLLQDERTEFRPRFQFTLSRLMMMIAMCSLLLALWAWDGDLFSWAPEVFLAMAFCLIVVGACLRSWMSVVSGASVLIAVMFSLGRPEYNSALHGIRIKFRVIDKQTVTPVPGATVRLLTITTKEGVADGDGLVSLRGYVKYDATYDTGGPEPNYQGSWVEVKASGYKLFRKPLDQLLSTERVTTIRLSR